MGNLDVCQMFLVIAPCLALSGFLGFGVLSFIITVPILILSSIFLITFSKKQNQKQKQKQKQKQNPSVDEKLLQDENPTHDSTGNFLENEAEEEIELSDDEAAKESEPGDFPSDSESTDDHDDDDGSISSENFELDWMRCTNNGGGQNGVVSSTDSVSDDDDDDDDSLIEIAIPATCSSNLMEEEEEEEAEQPKAQKMLPSNLLPESLMRQHGLLELFADSYEVNEEENLIEIDISMGSIKMFKA